MGFVLMFFRIAVAFFKSPREWRNPWAEHGFGRSKPATTTVSSRFPARKTAPLSSLSDTTRGNLLLRWRNLPDGTLKYQMTKSPKWYYRSGRAQEFHFSTGTLSISREQRKQRGHINVESMLDL